ncbi:MAG: ATP-dependent RNA helicase RhlE [Cellvibrionales bacterium]|nr:MAG: ATP-dependent RNA helicase RhlE [Cellvibrionales bacterium]
MTAFNELGLNAKLIQNIAAKGYDTPSPIQAKAIPLVLSGRDLMAAAQTGTGKTAAFTLPALHMLKDGPRPGPKDVSCLILTPTRELAAQIADNIRTYGAGIKLHSQMVCGGVNIRPQIRHLARGTDMLVATPGRLLDLLGQGAVRLDHVKMWVLDEADRMLDMGFIPAMRRVHAELPKKRQTLMFSATFSREIEALAGEFLHQPQKIQVTPANTTVSRIDQTVYPVDKARKTELLKHLVASERWGQVLVFSRTKYGADKISRNLSKAGISSDSIHGDKKQGARTRSLKQFKDGRLQVLVATDIAARGIDIQQLPRVVNFDLPHVAEDYVHRIGRTGRAGETGIALSLVSADEVSQLQKIEKLIKKSIPREEIDGFEPEHRLPTKPVKTSGKRLPKKAKAKPGAKKHREGQGKKRQGGLSAQRQGRAAKRGGRNRKPARART